MKKYSSIITVILTLSLLISCGGGDSSSSSSSSTSSSSDTSLVTITIGDSGKTASMKIEKNTLFAQAKMFLKDLIKPDTAIAAIPSSVYKILFTIGASDMTTIAKEVVVSGQISITETFVVPNGSNRYFYVEAMDSPQNHPIYAGETYADLDGSTITLDITMNSLIEVMFNSLILVLNKGANLTSADLEPYFSTNYGINDGLSRSQTISEWVSGMPTTDGSKQFTSITLNTIEATDSGDYQVAGVAYFSDGSFGFWDSKPIVTFENDSWKLKGNGYKSDVSGMNALTQKWIKADGSIQTESGVDMEIEDNGNYDLQTAVITGSLISGSGITMSKCSYDNTELCLDSAYRNNTIPTDQDDFLVLDDTTISQMSDNAQYTIKFYDSNNNLIETRTVTLQKRPFMRSELTDGHFPTLSGISSHAISAMNIGGTLTFTYGKPTAYTTAWLWTELNFNDNSGNNLHYDKDLLLTQTSASFTTSAVSWSPTWGLLKVAANDEYRRNVVVNWIFE